MFQPQRVELIATIRNGTLLQYEFPRQEGASFGAVYRRAVAGVKSKYSVYL